MQRFTILSLILFGILALAGCEKNKEVVPDDILVDHSQEQPNMKGYDLYTWSVVPGDFHYAMLYGTNRFKNTEELMLAQENIRTLKKAIRFMPNNTHIMWNHKLFCNEMPGVPFALPKESLINELKEICKEKGIELGVDQ